MNENLDIKESNLKVKNKFKIPLFIIFILIILLISVGILINLNHKLDKSPDNIYYASIDMMESKLSKIISENEVTFNNKFSNKGNIKINLTSNDEELKKLSNIINNFDINYVNEMDYQNKVTNTLFGVSYKNNKIADLNLMIKNNDAFVNLENLFDKVIKISNDSIKDIWNLNYSQDLLTILENMSKIIKDNLKEDYFTKEKTNILINDKKVDVYNYEMYVSKDELNKLISNIYKSIISNNNLMTALSNISKQSKEVLIEKLENVDEVNHDLKINVYLNMKNKIEKIEINAKNSLKIEKINNNTYEINILENEKNTKIGTFNIIGNTYEFELEIEGVILKGNIVNKNNKFDFLISIDYENSIFSVSCETNNKEKKFEIIINNDNNILNLNINNVIDNIESVKEFNINNYVDYNMITSENVIYILNKLLNNEGANLLKEDLNSLNINDYFEYGNGTEQIM